MTTTKRGHCCSRLAFGKVRFSGHFSSGALGPVDGVNPELSNLTCSMTYVEPGDIVFLTSDGISDNFDPVVGKFCVPKRTPDENKSGRINSSQHQQNSSLPAVAGE